MTRSPLTFPGAATLAWALMSSAASAAPNPAATPAAPRTVIGAPAGPAGAPAPGSNPNELTYEKFTDGATKQEGLFNVWRKEGRVYLELHPDQFDHDYLEHAVPANGLGGYDVYSGNVWMQEARIVRFERDGRRVTLIWPQQRLNAAPGTPLAQAISDSTADSIEGIAPVVTEDKVSGAVVVDVSLLLGDVMDFATQLNGVIEDPSNPGGSYHLDPSRTYFGPSKAFPKNVIIEADQTYASAKPEDAINTVTDPRAFLLKVKYNFAEIPASPDYMPRLADDRVGFWTNGHISFEGKTAYTNFYRYIQRWDIKPSDPSKRLSPAAKPILYTISNTIPVEYRQAIRDAVLEWNKAFERIGISGQMQVQDQPNDPNFDPDDIRYNVIRWVTNADPGFGAEAQIEWDPRTGEIFRSGVLIDADIIRGGNLEYNYLVAPIGAAAARTFDPNTLDPAQLLPEAYAPAGTRRNFHSAESDYGMGMAAQFQTGLLAMTLQDGLPLGTVPPKYMHDFVKSIALHELGHDFGLAHNFIGHNAYTAAQIRDKNFTDQHGIVTSVMEYEPLNLWPRGTSHGPYYQTVLGSYDYHVIHWGYALIPGAKTPADEVPTLNRWASAASDPRYAFASDEDVEYDGHAVDPRIAQFLLTDKPIDWCETQLGIMHHLIGTLDARLPGAQMPWDEERYGFRILIGQYARCANSLSHYVAAEYLSRSRRGDPGAPAAPLTPVPRALEERAMNDLGRYMFADSAWQVPPHTLQRLVYSEYEDDTTLGYNPTPRHDISLAQIVGVYQGRTLALMFSPLVLQRLVDLPSKTKPGETMSLVDLFTWTQASIFGDIQARKINHTSLIRRNLQRRYAYMLSLMAVRPFAGIPWDAQALARYELGTLQGQIADNLKRKDLDLQTRAHLSALGYDIDRALTAKAVVPG